MEKTGTENQAESEAKLNSKRRSKKDQQGRSFKCDKCDKTYLSYPALYTHTKIKHSEGGDGKPNLGISSGKGRGRPKKSNDQKVDPTSDQFFKSEYKTGGPIDPYSSFEEELKYFENPDISGEQPEFPMTKFLKRFQSIFLNGPDPIPKSQENPTENQSLSPQLFKLNSPDLSLQDNKAPLDSN